MNYLPQRCRENLIAGVLLFLVFPFLSNASEIYRWTDDEGVVNVTDDRSIIPDKYWEEERVEKEEVQPSPIDAQPVKPETEPKETVKEGSGRELFGDYPLEWWIYKLQDARKNIAESQERIDQEKNFVAVFEGGRRYGKIYTSEEIAQYESYKTDIPVAEEKLKVLKEQLEGLNRKARINGVPKKFTE